MLEAPTFQADLNKSRGAAVKLFNNGGHCLSNQVMAMCFDITALNKGRIKSASDSLVSLKCSTPAL
jgi:hypothetical protein